MERVSPTGNLVIDDFLKDCANRGMTVGSTNSYKYSIKTFVSYLQNLL